MGQHGRILVVDDEPKIRSFIGRALTSAGYTVDLSGNCVQALRAADESRYDLVILDLVMPDSDGRQVLRGLLERRSDQPVIVLSCVADVATKVDLLERGAQDYLTKPFSLAELLARVRVQLRTESPAEEADQRTAPPRPLASPLAPPQAAEVIQVGNVLLDFARLVVDIGQGPIPLTRLEFLLLRELAEHVGESVSKGRLLSSVWGYDFDPGSNVVDVCVRRLRSKLGFELIKTVRGEGYQLVAS